jgi:hypothetical protein
VRVPDARVLDGPASACMGRLLNWDEDTRRGVEVFGQRLLGAKAQQRHQATGSLGPRLRSHRLPVILAPQ